MRKFDFYKFKKAAVLACFLFGALGSTAQVYWNPATMYILNVQTNETFTGAGALTLAHDDADTQDGHTLRFMPAGLDIYSTGVFDTDHDPTNVTKALTIDGNGATITNDNGSSNTSRALWLKPAASATITLLNMTLCSFSNTTGAAILSSPKTLNGKIVMTNVNVYGSYNSGYAVQLEHNADITDCNIGNPNGANTGGLKIFADNLPAGITVNITNSTFNCNNQPAVPGAGLWLYSASTHRANTVTINGCTFNGNDVGGSYGAAIYNQMQSGSVLTVNNSTFIGNTGSNTSGAAVYYGTGSSTTSYFNECTFINNDRNALYGGTSTHYIVVDECKFLGNPNGVTRVRASGSISNSIVYNTALHTDGTKTNNVMAGTTSTFDDVLGTYYVQGYGAVSCAGGCQNSSIGTGAQITFPACLTPGSTLTSTQSGTWYYQQSGSAAVSLGTGTTATIPSGLSGYTVFWQDVATGSDPVFAGDVQSYAIGSNTNTVPTNMECLGSISGNVFQDGNTDPNSANGSNGDGNDTNLSGVTVELVYSGCTQGVDCPTTTTDASGNYEFYNLPAGDYTVVFTSPSGMISTTLSNTGSTTADSDVATANVNPLGGSSVSSPTITIVTGLVAPLSTNSSNDDTFTGASNYQGVGIGFTQDPVFPVEFVSFEGSNDDCSVSLTWKTASELNSAYFEIQQSTDGKTFTAIGRVEAAGNSTTIRKYSFNYSDFAANNFYRLKQVDFDGAFMYSKTIAVRMDKCIKGISINNLYPNPVSNQFTLEVSSDKNNDTQILVFDVLGKVVYNNAISLVDGNNIITLDAQNWSKGVYFVKIQAANTAIRFVKE